MHDETIAAISTPLGEGGIGIVRLSGMNAVAIAEELFSSPKGKRLEETESHKLTYGLIKDPETNVMIDEVLVAVMKAPHTYTKEDIVEINCHGGMLPVRKVLELVLHHGARLAEPGEFTKRAFLNGRIDLSRAEAVIDLIRAKTDTSAKIAMEQLSGGLSDKITALRDRLTDICAHMEAYIDFPEEEIEPASLTTLSNEMNEIKAGLSLLSESFEEGRFLREGLRVAIVGKPNVGKSSLLNALLRRDRAIVTEAPGTTRDVLEEYLNLRGLPARIMDTAGIRETHEMAEKEGVMRSLRAIDDADIVIGIFDGSSPLKTEDVAVLEKIRDKKAVIAINKSDLPSENEMEARLGFYGKNILKISAKTGEGLDLLKDRIIDMAVPGSHRIGGKSLFEDTAGVMVTNVRHKVAIDGAIIALDNAASAVGASSPLEIISVDLRDALDKLGEIVGRVTTEDILDRIFNEFCIGK